jgi:hypothetical protein
VFGLFSLERFRAVAASASVDASTCNHRDSQQWILSSVDGTVRNKHDGQCLIQVPELEVWSAPLDDGSAAVVLLNRGNSVSEPITVQWTDIGFPVHDSALVRDLWARKALGPYRANYTSPNIDPHSVMMLKITLYQ